MKNAKAEFIEHIKQRKVECFEIVYEKSYDEKKKFYYNSTIHTFSDLECILDQLNFEYDNGYGHQYIYGTIWYKDGTWSIRYEYDGSESWYHHECPPLPAPPEIDWPLEVEKFLKAVSWTSHGHKATACLLITDPEAIPIQMGTDQFKKLAALLKQHKSNNP